MMSSSKNYHISAASLQNQATPTGRQAQETYKLTDPSSEPHQYQVLEQARAMEEAQANTSNEYEESTGHQYHIIEPPINTNHQSSANTDGEDNLSLAPAEYEEFTPREDQDPHVYQPLQPQQKGPPRVYANKKLQSADSGVYASVSTNSRHVTSPPSSVMPSTLQKLSTAPHSTQDSAQVETNLKKARGFKIALVCIGLLVIIVVTGIATAALVLALINTSECGCEGEIQELRMMVLESQGRLDKVEDTINSDYQPQYNIDDYTLSGIVDSFSTYEEKVGKNEGDISLITATLSDLTESTLELNNTLLARIRNLRTLVRDIPVVEGCTATIEQTCTIPNDSQPCTTEPVQLERNNHLTTSFTCGITPTEVIEESVFRAAPIVDGEEASSVRCHCTSMVPTAVEASCALIVTRCPLTTPTSS